jgi:hypothetical protein
VSVRDGLKKTGLEAAIAEEAVTAIALIRAANTLIPVPTFSNLVSRPGPPGCSRRCRIGLGNKSFVCKRTNLEDVGKAPAYEPIVASQNRREQIYGSRDAWTENQ